MRFLIEKMSISEWSEGSPPIDCGEVAGADANTVLLRLVTRDGGIPLGPPVSFRDGQAVTLVQNGTALYALRAVPRATSPS